MNGTNYTCSAVYPLVHVHACVGFCNFGWVDCSLTCSGHSPFWRGHAALLLVVE
jgi:hypothetical protein